MHYAATLSKYRKADMFPINYDASKNRVIILCYRRGLFNSYAEVLKHLQIQNFHPALVAILTLKVFLSGHFRKCFL